LWRKFRRLDEPQRKGDLVALSVLAASAVLITIALSIGSFIVWLGGMVVYFAAFLLAYRQRMLRARGTGKWKLRSR
jgi:hypothetical protein